MAYLQIKYRNSCDLAGSVFQKPEVDFYYVLYLDSDVGTPTFETIDEGREDGEKNFISDFKKSTKRYQFNTVVPEYQLDALMSIMLHDTVQVKLKNGENNRVFNFTVTPADWINENIINVTISFTVNYDIATGCCNNEQIVYAPCYKCTNIAVAGWVSNTSFSSPDRGWWMVGTLVGGEIVNNDLQQYRFKSGWVKRIGGKDEVVCFTLNSIDYHFLWDGQHWQPANFIRSSSVSGSDVTIRAWCYPNTFAQLYKSFGGGAYVAVGAPVLGSTMQNVGVKAVGCAAGANSFKVLIYNNNCNYGYTNIVTVTV
jgi:hypothetical protein